MKLLYKFSALLLVFVLAVMLALPVSAAQDSTDELVRQLINYYHHYQRDARLDYELILEQIREQDPALADTWNDILTFWLGVNDDMQFHSGVLPDGLPEDDSLCIAVMGYYLESDGGIRDELYTRLQVALKSAEKYPNAYILCTGGGTASQNETVTEASQMAKWLIKKGIAQERIIVEDQARSTIQNAIYGCDLLYRNYPQVRSIAVITSDYHIYRSCVYFHTQAALAAYDRGIDPICVVSNATCKINPGASRDVSRQVEGIGMLTDLDVVDMEKPELTQLQGIRVAGQSEYVCGGELRLTVTAEYSNGYTRDVTDQAQLSGFDFSIPGFHGVTVNYEDFTEVFDIYVLPPETEPSAAPEAESTAEPETEAVIAAAPDTADEAPRSRIVYLLAVLLVVLFFLLWLKQRTARKRRRRPRPSMKLD